MSAIVSLQGVGKAFGLRPLFTNISLTLSEGERVGMIGANGSGKSTLLRILAGLETPDAGERVTRKLVTLAYLPQEDRFEPGQSVEVAVAGPLLALGASLSEAETHVRVGAALSRAGFADPSQSVDGLSGGQRKRLALARALIVAPDAVFLDEPTNHLDLESILRLEKTLQEARYAFIVVSHDRAFLEKTTRRTIELGRAYPEGYLAAEGPYSVFLERRAAFLAAQAGQVEALAGRMRREIEWLRRGPKARTTKAKYRIDAAGRLADELAQARERNAVTRRAAIDFTESGRRTKRLIAAEGLGKSLGGRTLFSDLDITLSPGLRLGLAGANGSGKTTLLRVLAGELEQDQGTLSRAPNVRIAVFDQNRAQLDPQTPLRRAFTAHGDSVDYRGRLIHIASWAKRFLFRPEQLDLPMGLLSGGEQARALIARLMLTPADVLFLDEPTNDLDIPTLETLEESLCDFPGAVVLISHDRLFLDTVSTVVLGLDNQGGAEVFADYAQWEAAGFLARPGDAAKAESSARQAPAKAQRQDTKKKLSYLEQREWETMEKTILAAEERLEACQAALDDPAVASDPAALHARLEAFTAAQAEVARLYARWEELEGKLGEGREG